jgi:L-asparaginase / beta-aspartyl-peptidase
MVLIPSRMIKKIFLLIFFSSNTYIFSQSKEKLMNNSFTLVIHGGAGTILKKNMTEEKEKEYENKMKEVLATGYEILKSGGTSMDAVEACIKIMEDSPLFNAGKGSVFTSAGTNEMDASIMDGSDLKAGAVAVVKTIKHPISAARAVMEKSPHVMMIGGGAEEFARKSGLEIVPQNYFFDSVRYQQWQNLKESEQQQLDHDGRGGNVIDKSENEFNVNIDTKFGTVGAVAVDRYGNLAAGTSTGGMTNKKYGRVGDSPIIGAGTYADNKTCAVSATGHGEYFIRLSVAKDIASLMDYKNLTVDAAANEVIHNKLAKLGGNGGVIAVDKNGNLSMPFNTAGMYRGYVKEDGNAFVKIYAD